MNFDYGAYPSDTFEVTTGCVTMYLTIAYEYLIDGTHVKGVSITAGKAGGCASAHLLTLSAFVNEALKYMTPSQRLSTYANLTGFKCIHDNCCVDKIIRIIMNKEIKLIEKREEIEDEQ